MYSVHVKWTVSDNGLLYGSMDLCKLFLVISGFIFISLDTKVFSSYASAHKKPKIDHANCTSGSSFRVVGSNFAEFFWHYFRICDVVVSMEQSNHSEEERDQASAIIYNNGSLTLHPCIRF